LLQKYKTYLINLDDSKDRFESSTKILNSINQPFERFSAIRHKVGVIGCGLSHLELLKNISIETLILEDDIALTQNSLNLNNIPQSADAVYLGVSKYGYVRKIPHGVEGSVLVSQFDENYKRVYNMCSTHAILYLSKRYIDACKITIINCLNSGVPFDLGLASIHRHFTVLTPNDPMFYQENQPKLTNLSLQIF